jgi:hypothetical protein
VRLIDHPSGAFGNWPVPEPFCRKWLNAHAFPDRENAMKIAKIVLVGAAALVAVSSAALAQQTHTGTVTQLNRLNNTVAIRQTQDGTVGANTGGAAEEFKVGNGVSLETLHAGDIVSYSVNESDGTKTITKLDRR